jgi:hypothetical protein
LKFSDFQQIRAGANKHTVKSKKVPKVKIKRDFRSPGKNRLGGFLGLEMKMGRTIRGTVPEHGQNFHF